MSEQNIIPWPPAYSVRFSPKAKRAIIYVRRSGRVEIALPQSAGHSSQFRTHAGAALFAEQLLMRHRDWVLDQLASRGVESASADALGVPDLIDLNATGERIQVCWSKGSTRNAYCLLSEAEGLRLALSTKNTVQGEVEITEELVAVTLLRTWTKDYALRVFEPQLRSLAAQHDLRVQEVKSRLQRTRLGSCTRHGVISLNAAMLFFPPELVRHLMLHELCHLKEMNHSQAFWKLLLSFDAKGLQHDKALKKAWKAVPGWVFK